MILHQVDATGVSITGTGSGAGGGAGIYSWNSAGIFFNLVAFTNLQVAIDCRFGATAISGGGNSVSNVGTMLAGVRPALLLCPADSTIDCRSQVSYGINSCGRACGPFGSGYAIQCS